jgi:hypothetical protein
MHYDFKRYFKQMGIALLSIGIGISLYVVLSGLSGLLTVHDYSFHPIPAITGTLYYMGLPWLVLLPLVFWFADRVPIRPSDWVKGVFLHLLLFLPITLLHATISAQLYYHSDDVTPAMAAYDVWQHSGHFLFLDDMFLYDALIYIFLVASRNISNFHSLAQRKELDALRMQSQLNEARLQALLMQVNPHFLFNTLNSIAVLIRMQDNARATTMIERLSAYFRHTLDAPLKQWLPLNQELHMVEQYLDIEKVRIGPRLSVQQHIAAQALSVPVPALLLQPLVENAIRHGIGRKAGACELRIDAVVEHGKLILTISDTGAGCDFSREREGIGLANVRERLQQCYGDAAMLEPRGDADGVTVRLTLPQRHASSEEHSE